MARRPSSSSDNAPGDRDVLYIVPSDGAVGEQYFFSDEEMSAAITPEVVARALALAGAWSDLDADEMLTALERIRHGSVPTPPLDDLD